MDVREDAIIIFRPWYSRNRQACNPMGVFFPCWELTPFPMTQAQRNIDGHFLAKRLGVRDKLDLAIGGGYVSAAEVGQCSRWRHVRIIQG